MFKKIILTIVTLTIVSATIQIVHGYSIPNEYRPINAPLGDLAAKDTNRQNDDPNRSNSDPDVLTNTLLQVIAGTLLYFAAPIAVFSIAQSAFTITAGGADTEKLEQGKKHLTWAILGLIAIIFAYSIVKIAITFVVDVGNYASTTVQRNP